MDRLHTLWRHYSSQALIAVATIGALKESLPELSPYLPGWLVSLVAVCGLAGKLIPQGKR